MGVSSLLQTMQKPYFLSSLYNGNVWARWMVGQFTVLYVIKILELEGVDIRLLFQLFNCTGSNEANTVMQEITMFDIKAIKIYIAN